MMMMMMMMMTAVTLITHKNMCTAGRIIQQLDLRPQGIIDRLGLTKTQARAAQLAPASISC